jgi:hypothetical protein
LEVLAGPNSNKGRAAPSAVCNQYVYTLLPTRSHPEELAAQHTGGRLQAAWGCFLLTVSGTLQPDDPYFQHGRAVGSLVFEEMEQAANADLALRETNIRPK